MYVKEKVEFAAIFSTHHFHQIFFLPRCFQPSCNGNRFENDSPRGSRIEFSNPTLRSRVLNISTQVTIKWHCFSLHCLFFSSTYQNKISIFLVLLRWKTTGWVFFVWLTMDYSFWTECWSRRFGCFSLWTAVLWNSECRSELLCSDNPLHIKQPFLVNQSINKSNLINIDIYKSTNI